MSKRLIALMLVIMMVALIIGCSQKNLDKEIDKNEINAQITGAFVVTIRDIIPDYCLDNFTPQVAVVTQFQDSPFTMYLGEKFINKVEIGKTYVIEIDTLEIGKINKEELGIFVSPLIAFEKYGAKIKGIRLATEEEIGITDINIEITEIK